MSLSDTNAAIFARLTEKQVETAKLLAEGLTGKEMATALNVSHSAVAQRIETLRGKFGGITKNELARKAREWFAAQDAKTQGHSDWHTRSSPSLDEACIKYTGQKNHLPDDSGNGQQLSRNQPEPELVFEDSFAFNASPPWTSEGYERLVPEVLDGEHAAPARWAFVVVAAIGMAVLVLVLLAVANALSDLA